MKTLTGVGVGSAAVTGPILRFATPDITPPGEEAVPTTPEEIAEAQERLATSIDAVVANLREMAATNSDETLQEILAATAEIAADPALKSRSNDIIADGNGPAAAITTTIGEFAEIFKMSGEYMAERVSDLNSIRDRVIAHLFGIECPGIADFDEPSVVVAHELTPADTSLLDMSKVLALVTEAGGATSHTAIIARQNDLACVVQVQGILEIEEGSIVAVDSARGQVIVDPDDAIKERVRKHTERRAQLLNDDRPGETADGHRIELLANIGTYDDAKEAAKSTAEGVGLLRTEFIFINSEEEPSIEEQADTYRKILNEFKGKKVVIRTLDSGADKPLRFATTTDDPNPALGVRAYRLTRTNPQLYRNQLAALALAINDCPETKAWVMAPMIATVEGAAAFHELAAEAGIEQVGIMIEIPSVAVIANHVLKEVDFASIGTNDLAQYTMASDRELGMLSDLLNHWQPAILNLVASSAQAGKELGRPVGVCGESASDPLMALVLCGLGITSLSMAPNSIPDVRFALRNTTFEACQQMAQAAISAPTADTAKQAVIALLSPEVKEVFAAEDR